LKISKNAFAKVIGVSAPRLGQLTLKQNGISPDLALRLSTAFNTTPEYWMNLQTAWELAQARKQFKDDGKIRQAVVALVPIPKLPWAEIEKRTIIAAFEKNQGNIYAVARELDIAPNTAYRKLKEYGKRPSGKKPR
jgi:addiction module HigA family antidote